MKNKIFKKYMIIYCMGIINFILHIGIKIRFKKKNLLFKIWTRNIPKLQILLIVKIMKKSDNCNKILIKFKSNLNTINVTFY